MRQYLSVAEAEDLKRMKAPPQTPQEFARHLPYAVALGVEAAWAQRFATLLGASAIAAAVTDYYSSDRGADGVRDLGGTSDSLGSAISSAATPPGSSSGFSDSGGSSDSGSSGGGGGGGGGSGW